MTGGPAVLRAAGRPALQGLHASGSPAMLWPLVWPAATWLAICCAMALLLVSAPALAAGDRALAGASNGDPVRGARQYEERCAGCHSVSQNRVGPAHQGVYGRRAGQAPGFDYSPALAQSRLVWTERNLDAWLTDPQALIPGQKMFVQVGDSAVRADLVAYLRTLIANPAGSPAATH